MATRTIDRMLSEREFKDINRRVIALDRLNMVYLVTPKVACSNIKRMLYLSEARHRGLTDLEKTLVSQRGIVHQPKEMPLPMLRSYSPRRRERFLSDPNVFRFTFVRNPYSRILSGYLDKFVRSRAARPAVKFKEEFGYAPDKTPTFAEFVRGVVTQKPMQRNPHWRDLVNLVQPDIIDYALIGRLESFDADIEKVRAHIPKSERDEPEAHADLHGAHQTRASQKLMDYYDDETIALVAEAYAGDFAAFGYSTDFHEALKGR